MKKTIFGILAATLITVMATGCSDNFDNVFEPNKIERTIAVDIESDNYDNGTLSLGPAPSTMEVKVESNTRWLVEVECPDGWCDVDVINGTKDGSFFISVRENMKDEERKCEIYVYKVNKAGEKDLSEKRESIIITQTASNVRLMPSSLEPFPAQSPESKEFQVISNVHWTLSVEYEGTNATEFITITPLSDAMQSDGKNFTGETNAKFAINLQDNRTAASRKAYLVLNSEVSTYTVEISQQASEYTFDVSPAENQVIPATGGQKKFVLQSLSSWKINKTADWISFTPPIGTGSNLADTIIATIAPNTTGSERQAEIRFTPDDDKYIGVPKIITQRGFDLTFSMSPESFGVISESGASKTISINSRFDWDLDIPDWIIAEKYSGTASLTEQKVILTIPKNETNDTQTGTITLYPKTTDFGKECYIIPNSAVIKPLQ
ncbi:MAG: hypothetical protein K2K84_00895, partial [Muribaculaceae bacterium]|nr:hypothetical protein [Muribaculaceae bacterium]